MAFSAFNTGVAIAVRKRVTQVAHGLSVGNVVRLNGAGAFVTAQANSAANALAVGIVSQVVDADTFFLTEEGYINTLAGLVAGSIYYLSPSVAGALTLTKPTTVGQVVRPMIIADSATSGYVMYFEGTTVVAGGNLPVSVVAVDTAMAVNTAYVLTGVTGRNFLLPPTATVGDRIWVANIGTGNFTITQNANQTQYLVNNAASTVGVGGSVAGTQQYSLAELVCVVTDNEWLITNAQGNFTVV